MLKRYLYKDERAVTILDLPKPSLIILGRVIQDPLTENYQFCSYPSTESLKKANLEDNDTVWIFIEKGSNKEMKSLKEETQ